MRRKRVQSMYFNQALTLFIICNTGREWLEVERGRCWSTLRGGKLIAGVAAWIYVPQIALLPIVRKLGPSTLRALGGPPEFSERLVSLIAANIIIEIPWKCLQQQYTISMYLASWCYSVYCPKTKSKLIIVDSKFVPGDWHRHGLELNTTTRNVTEMAKDGSKTHIRTLIQTDHQQTSFRRTNASTCWKDILTPKVRSCMTCHDEIVPETRTLLLWHICPN